MRPEYGIIVPVRNETAVLPVTVPKLLAATKNDPVRIIWVCNGCTDGSGDVIRRLAGPGAEVIERTSPGKTAALQAGDDLMGTLFPRLYLDADTWLRPGDPLRLIQPLLTGAADLVAPRLLLDTVGVSQTSARIGACWLSLPHAQTTAFSNAIGLSAAARNLWRDWPDITGDDIFVSAQVPADRKLIFHDAFATIRIPRQFSGWVRMRARWLRGEVEIAQLGLKPPRPDQQRLSLLKQMMSMNTARGAWAFGAARLLGGMSKADPSISGWLPDRR